MPNEDSDFLIPRRRHSGLADPTPEQARSASAKLDLGLAAIESSYDETFWSLGATLRWIVERTRAAVDGLSVDDDELPEAAREPRQACDQLRATSGYLCAT
jgi:hypothetical protein